MHFGFVISHLCGDGHWKAMRSTTLNPHSSVRTPVAYIILWCLEIGVTDARETSREPLAATIVSTLRISLLNNA
jgi:hypothetical protein